MGVNQQITIDFDVPAKMRDGITLRANIYRPVDEGQWPVLLMRFPYGKDFPIATSLLDPVQLARHGYVVIVQDTRGRATSEGEWDPMRNEALDGVDTIEWASKLPYSNGSVGMYGDSYGGFTQWSAAIHQPPALKAMIPVTVWNDPLNGSTFRGGALELGLLTHWQLMLGLDVLLRRYHNDPQARGHAIYKLVTEIDTMGTQGYWSLPLKEFRPLKCTDIAPTFFELFDHPMDREYMEPVTILGKHEQVTVPTLHIGGWYDVFLQDTIENFRIMRQRGSTSQARHSKLLIGPWTHSSFSAPIGEMNFGMGSTRAFIDLQTDLASLHVRWYDQFLKGMNTGILNEAPIKLFVMGANAWRDEQEWPLSRAVETRYYLHSGGHANTLDGDGILSTQVPASEQFDQYVYDPAHPVITRGGALLMTPEFPRGPYNQRTTENREDVLVYSTPILEDDVEVTGPIVVHLYAASSALDTDFVARLVDVHPDGYAQNLTDGIIRARYRNFAHGEQPSLIESSHVYEYKIDLWATSNLFKKGHRIRLDVTSSCFPRWDRNPNTGHDLGADGELVVAHQTILHDADHPSYVLLPIVPSIKQ